MVTLPTVPGKLMIAGEYAVLRDDGAALAVAAGSLAEATLHDPVDAAPADSAHRLHAFGRSWPLVAATDGLAAFATAALQAARAQWQAVPRHEIALQVHGQVAGRKVGLGTSAAVTVAMLRAVARSAGQSPRPAAVAALAREVHHRLQGDKGSGYDVTAIAHGGCIAYFRDPDRAVPQQWPAGLAAAAFFSGEPAPTADALGRMARIAPALAGIAASTRILLDVWPQGDVSAVLTALDRCERALDEAGRLDPGLLPPAVEQVRRHLREHGLVARTSGAGGGDCVLGWGRPGEVDRAVAAWRAAGGTVVVELPAAIAPTEEHVV